jgi:hypothetical protein
MISRFLEDKSKPISDDFDDTPTPADTLGARMVGRWKSGTSTDGLRALSVSVY